MHIICDLTDHVDYINSKFFVYYNFSKNIGYVDISSKDELSKKENTLKKLNPGKSVAIWAEEVALKNDSDIKLDLFQIGNFSANYFISEFLKAEIQKKEIIGCSFMPAGNLIFQNGSP
jgi:hypothetical protein